MTADLGVHRPPEAVGNTVGVSLASVATLRYPAGCLVAWVYRGSEV
jgi:hypothetical protein